MHDRFRLLPRGMDLTPLAGCLFAGEQSRKQWQHRMNRTWQESAAGKSSYFAKAVVCCLERAQLAIAVLQN